LKVDFTDVLKSFFNKKLNILWISIFLYNLFITIILSYSRYWNNIYIKEIKEDDTVAYFIRFSNNDILHIYEYVDGLEDWFLDFEIVSPKNKNYDEIITHMNETWVNIMTW